MNPRDISISDFTYELPPERIAVAPLKERDQSKLLIWNKGRISESRFSNIADLLEKDDLLVFNQTRVVPARLYFKTSTGATVEIFCLGPAEGLSIQEAMQKSSPVNWECLVGNSRKWKDGEKVILEHFTLTIEALRTERKDDVSIVRFSWEPNDLSFSEVLQIAGEIPLPPYLKRKPSIEDTERYQTIFANYEGSVAAPTAGLHFSEQVLDKLRAKGVHTAFLTLHVGAGTFKPVKSDTMEGHAMHTEEIRIDAENLEKIAACKGRVFAVGTTSLRSLESIFRAGIGMLDEGRVAPFLINQWEVYDKILILPDRREVFGELVHLLKAQKQDSISGTTSLLIAPGYKVSTADALITNFHQPGSTLLLLVAAITGHSWRDIYRYALENNFRFLSYGDSSVLFI